jgi:hypothetical protein
MLIVSLDSCEDSVPWISAVFFLSALDSAVLLSAVLLSAVLLSAALLSAADELFALLEASLFEEESSPQAVSIDPTMQRLSAPARTLLSFAIIISSLNIALYLLSYSRNDCKILMPLVISV